MNKKIISRLLILILIFTMSSGIVYAGDDVPDEEICVEEPDEDASDEEIYVEEPEEDASDEEVYVEEPEEDVSDEESLVQAPGDEIATEVFIIISKKANLNDVFYAITGDKKYEVSNKKLASVNNKGILTVKKAGTIDVNCLTKADGKWVIAETRTFELKVPKAAMKTIPAGTLYKEGQSINLNDYIVDNSHIIADNWYAKADPEVAVFDDQTGELTAGTKNGKVTVYAEYRWYRAAKFGEDSFARKIKFTVKIDHKKISLAEKLYISQGVKARYTVSDKKIATINKKGILSFKKEGSVTVNIQYKEEKKWVYKSSAGVSYTIRNNSGKYDIQEGIAERDLAEDGSYTTKEDVSYYIYRYDSLPQNFITKKEAQALGWPGGGLDGYADGKCIGGDYFSNYEGMLPEGDYRECDIDTLHKKSRGAKRLVYDLSDGDIYYTPDHYKTFIQLY